MQLHTEKNHFLRYIEGTSETGASLPVACPHLSHRPHVHRERHDAGDVDDMAGTPSCCANGTWIHRGLAGLQATTIPPLFHLPLSLKECKI
jgi:hypothetical protein